MQYCMIIISPLLLEEEGRYGAQTTHVTYATQSAHTYQQTAQPQSAAYAREPPASNSSKYGTTAPSQSAFSSYPSHYAAHQQKTITDAHYPAGYRVPAQAGQHGKLLNTKYHHEPTTCTRQVINGIIPSQKKSTIMSLIQDFP